MHTLNMLLELNSKLAYHDDLNPKLWHGETLKANVSNALKKIADLFATTLGVDSTYLVDIIFTGSNANFNWSSLSDIDIHLMVDLDNLQCDDCKLDTEGCLQAKKSLWNISHDIAIFGHTVEVYVCDSKADLVGSAAAYSLKTDSWIQKPNRVDKRLSSTYTSDMVGIKADEIALEIDQAISTHTDEPDVLRDLNDKLSKLRSAGLKSMGEFSLENAVFKALRNNGYVQKLRSQISNLDDKSLSLE